VQIRKATPEDAAFLAKAILIAGRAHVKKVYGDAQLGGVFLLLKRLPAINDGIIFIICIESYFP
jgi:hypothetical protein